jgi:hypothetical protein
MAKKAKKRVIKPAPRRRWSTKKRAASTALVLRKRDAKATADLERLAPEVGMNLGAFGLVELKFTKHEEEVLSERVDPKLIQWRPREKDGPPVIPYYPHQEYTRWFNRAFGRTGWTLVPIAKPSINRSEKNPSQATITQPYLLHVHGKPIAYAAGEQEYFEGNKQQSFGDALESCHASALRRCAKHLGIGLELWDKAFINQLRPGAAPMPAAGPEPSAPRTYAPPVREAEVVGHHATSGEPITDKQRKRLWAIIKNSGRNELQVKSWLERFYGWTSTSQVTRREYEFVCTAIESPADLPERQP